MRDLHSSIDESDLVDRFNFGGETTMNTEDFAFDDGSNAKVVEDFSAVFPWVGISILSNSFIVESINGGNLSSLVITSKESNMSWVLHLKTKKKLESFN